jgi:hypothetical protein
MTDMQTLWETTERIKELAGKLAGKLEELLVEEISAKPLIKINAGIFFDTRVDMYDLYTFIDISSCADDNSGITGGICPSSSYDARSMRKLETRGYLKKVHSDESAHIYELCGPDMCVKLPQIASVVWKDSRLTISDRLVYVALCLFSNTFGKGVALSVRKIADVAKCWEYSARDGLRKLEQLGLITVERSPRKINIYRISQLPTSEGVSL